MSFINKSALLFDLDGTLVDSAPDLALAVNRMLEELGRPGFDQEVVRGWVGNGAQVLVERALSGSAAIDSGLDPHWVAKALKLFHSHYRLCLCTHTQLYPGVKDTLIALKTNGYRLAIVTNKPEAYVEPILQGLALEGLFELIIGGDTLSKRKPDPLPLLVACERLQLQPAQCVMIGDSKNDIQAAQAAELDSVGLTYGYNYGEFIDHYGPDWVLEEFSGLLQLMA